MPSREKARAGTIWLQGSPLLCCRWRAKATGKISKHHHQQKQSTIISSDHRYTSDIFEYLVHLLRNLAHVDYFPACPWHKYTYLLEVAPRLCAVRIAGRRSSWHAIGCGRYFVKTFIGCSSLVCCDIIVCGEDRAPTCSSTDRTPHAAEFQSNNVLSATGTNPTSCR